ncbi:HLH domain-containing protein [Cephalotus follicularis]|uniref:HLH domain-containing protein n=1 Tax=Cephalotus follicularis TaxID=3775 RepID=A0A1Q3BSS9_CEPFO|nr:HLH domain-containing protein [Cephalotus follicularis]
MELPQPCAYGTEGTNPTHDFLSLYSHSTVQQDPRPSSQDFLRVGKTSAKEEEEDTCEILTVEKQSPLAPPPSEEHILPGGFGTYSISHVSHIGNQSETVVPAAIKPEGTMIFTTAAAQASCTERNDENSNCSSFTGSGFTLWEESVIKKGKPGKDQHLGERSNSLRDTEAKAAGQWRTSVEQPTQSSANNHRNSFSPHSQSQLGQKSLQSFMEMIKSAKSGTHDEDLDDDEDLLLKKDNYSSAANHKGELRVKVDAKSTDQKANTPRSKHSATEQRRRSKINDRFQMLRELIPHGDQKRDKASFLLEVIEYIQFLQEKVHKYEGSYQGWNHEPAKLMPWRNSHGSSECYIDQSRGRNSMSGPTLMIPAKFDEKDVPISPTIPGSAQNKIESDVSFATPFKTEDHQPAVTNKAMPFLMSLQPNFLNSSRSGGAVVQQPHKLAAVAENIASLTQSQLINSTRTCMSDGAVSTENVKEQELTIEGGTISISSVYSQGLLNSLTQALHSSGVDLSRASISVQIEVGKRANSRSAELPSNLKVNEVPSSIQRKARSRVASDEDCAQAVKKIKTAKSSDPGSAQRWPARLNRRVRIYISLTDFA